VNSGGDEEEVCTFEPDGTGTCDDGTGACEDGTGACEDGTGACEPVPTGPVVVGYGADGADGAVGLTPVTVKVMVETMHDSSTERDGADDGSASVGVGTMALSKS
jgi:hypothetical protein